MKTYLLDASTTVPVPLEEAFQFFENPRNLARITPPWLNFRILSEGSLEMKAGLEVRYRISWLGLGLTWQTRIAEYHPPHSFVDEQISGPYRFWRHLHTFESAPGSTTVRDRVEYSLPFGGLGRLAHTLAVRRQLRGIFRYRERALAEIWRDGSTAPER